MKKTDEGCVRTIEEKTGRETALWTIINFWQLPDQIQWRRCLFFATLLLVAGISLMQNVLNLHYLEQEQPPVVQEAFWHGGVDTECYIANAGVLGTSTRFIKVFKERMALPILFRLSGATKENPSPYLRLALWMHFFFPLVLAAASWTLFGNHWLALLCAVSYLFADKSGSLMVLTDYLHAFLFVVAMWTTWKYLKDASLSWMVASIVAWDCCMLARPTFLWVGLMLFPLTSWGKKTWKEWAAKSLGHTGLLLVVPALLAVHNYSVYGVATPTFNALENIHTVLIPGIHTTIRKRTEVDTNSAQIWHEERDLKAWHEENYEKLELWNARVPDDRYEYRQAYQTVKATDKKVVISNLDVVWELMVSECGRMLMLSNEGTAWPMRIRCGFVMAALCGVVVSWRRKENRTSVVATMLFAGWILASSGTFLWAEQRFVKPVLLLMIPFAVSVLGGWRRIAGVIAGLCLYKGFNMISYQPLLSLAVSMLAMIICEIIWTKWNHDGGMNI